MVMIYIYYLISGYSYVPNWYNRYSSIVYDSACNLQYRWLSKPCKKIIFTQHFPVLLWPTRHNFEDTELKLCIRCD